MTFGEKLRAARKILNLTQTELAAITGISERSLYTYEQLDTLPRKSNIKKLADALHVSVAYLTDENETDPGSALEEEAFLAETRKRYGSRGARQAKEAFAQVNALFAGGDLDDSAKEFFMQSIMQVYLSSKEKASAKFTPNAVVKAHEGIGDTTTEANDDANDGANDEVINQIHIDAEADQAEDIQDKIPEPAKNKETATHTDEVIRTARQDKTKAHAVIKTIIY